MGLRSMAGNLPPQHGPEPDKTRRERIQEGIEALFLPGQVIDLRIPKAGKYRTISGYFDDPTKLALAIAEWSGKEDIEGVYCTLNPVNPALLARSANRAKTYAQLTTSDKDVVRRRWLLVDIDPSRPSGVSSTDAEKKLAGRKARVVRAYLRELGWPDPLAADSGNGYHLLYRIDLPNDEQSTALVKSCLEALAAKFNDDVVKVDTSVFNAARIVKAYGSLAAKGDSTAERPHRVASLLKTQLPGGREVVARDKLEGLAAEAPKPQSEQSAGNEQRGYTGSERVAPAKVEEFLKFYGVEHGSQKQYAGGVAWILKECPFDENHNGTSVAVVLRDDGKLGFECKHESCQQHSWGKFRKRLEDLNDGRKFHFVARTEKPKPTVQVEEIEPPDIHGTDTAPAYPMGCIDGDYIGDLAHAQADGTAIPLQFVRENIKVILGALVDGKIGYPGEEDIHTRQYNINISTHPESGKGESWRRIGIYPTGVLNDLLFDPVRVDENGEPVGLVEIVDGCLFGSGEYMVKELEDHPVCIARFDEMAALFLKDKIKASTLEQKFLNLYDSNFVATGSFKNDRFQADNVHLSVTGDFTRDGFTASFAGRGSRGSGFLSRCVLSFADKVPVKNDWREVDSIATTKAIAAIRDRLAYVEQFVAKAERFIPKESPEARARRLEFFNSLREQDRRFTGRLEAHMKRDLLARALFSPSKVIDAAMMDRSIAWCNHQLELRALLWPEDAGTPVERMERKILDVLKKRLDKVLHEHPGITEEAAVKAAGLSDRDLAKLCNVDREGSGGREIYSRAIKALAYGSREIAQVDKTRKNSPIWGLAKS